MRLAAERSPELSSVDPARVVALFDRYPPLTNPARAQYALALGTLGRSQAAGVAHAARRGGSMTDASETALLARYRSSFTRPDHDARLNALLWDGNAVPKPPAFQIAYASPAVRVLAMARLAYIQGSDPAAQGIAIPAEAMTDAGYVERTAPTI